MDDFKEKFPDKWICPYCINGGEIDCEINRDDIPSHLVYKHDWKFEYVQTWKQIYDRLVVIGGV